MSITVIQITHQGKFLFPPGPCGPGPCGLPCALVGQALVGPPGPLWALAPPLGPCGPGPCAPPGPLCPPPQVVTRRHRIPWKIQVNPISCDHPLWGSTLGPCGPPWPLQAPLGPLWARPLWAPLGPCGPPPDGDQKTQVSLENASESYLL